MSLLQPPPSETLQKLDFKSPALWLATWFGCGLMRPGPGTWGTLGAMPVGMILLALGGYPGLGIGLIIVMPVGFWAAAQFEKMTGEHDSGMIVIDEVAGMWIALFACVGQHPATFIAAFLLFRFFDILKPWPVSYFDRMGGAKGVMLDDVMAGIYAALILAGGLYAFAG